MLLVNYLSNLIAINFKEEYLTHDPVNEAKIREVARQKFKDNTRRDNRARVYKPKTSKVIRPSNKMVMIAPKDPN